MFVADQLVGIAATPLNFTLLDPWDAPKFEPLTVTTVPTIPFEGDTEVRLGDAEIVNPPPLLAPPPPVTVTSPVVAPAGTVTAMLVADHVVTVAVVPLNFTTLAPFVAPKFVPAIVTDAPTAPL